MLQFLTSSDVSNVANSLGIPKVSTEQVTGKLNNIGDQIHTVLGGTFGNIANIGLLISLVMLICCAIFKIKSLGKVALSIFIVLLAIVLFNNAEMLIGWASSM